MLLVTPCTDWYLVFTGLSKGNVELGMSILPLNLILQIVLMPVYLLIFIGNEVTMDVGALLGSVAVVLVIPLPPPALQKRLLRTCRNFRVSFRSRGTICSYSFCAWR